jgi:hypothetical protein
VSQAANEKVYIHEFIDIIGQNRARYMHHMTANYSPIAQEERGQQCYGVWGVVGSTGRWPQVVNIWEEDGFEGIAASFRHELSHPTLQDPKLAKWWAEAASYRSGGLDRILAPAPWMRTSAEVIADGVAGEVHAHVQVQVRPGAAPDYLDAVRELPGEFSTRFGWQLTGAWRTAMAGDAECILLWTIPTWSAWAEAEQAVTAEPGLGRLGGGVEVLGLQRFLMVDAPLSPFRTRRQPARSDRADGYAED